VVQFQLGVQLLKAGRLTDAMAALMASDALRPDNPDIATTLATAALRAGMTSEALSFAEQAVTRARTKDPASRVAAHVAALQVALALKDAEAGAGHVAEIGRLDPKLPLGDYLEGRVAFDEGRFEDAAAALQNASRALQDNVSVVPDLPILLGDALVQLDRLEDAEAAYRRALDVAPESVRAYTSLATLYQTSDRREAMAQTLDALIEEVPTAEGYAAAVRVFLAAGDRSRATALRAEARRRFRNELPLASPR
jgi:tetratricopeptide (TPR) repeat protein